MRPPSSAGQSLLARDPLVVDPSQKRQGAEHAGLRAVVQVAVGVLTREDGAFLLTSRPKGKPYEGYWEFPGGKYEGLEDGALALRRELREELGIDIDVQSTQAWRVQRVDYPHALVELNFFKVSAFRGAPKPLEGQQLCWSVLPVRVAPVLPGTVPVLEWLASERNFLGKTHT